MKKIIILIVAAIILLVGGYFLLDAYLCSHLYYGRGPFLSCEGGQGKGINIVGNNSNWYGVIRGLLCTLPFVLYTVYAKKISLQRTVSGFFIGLFLYVIGNLVMRDAFFGQGVLILIFNLAAIITILITFLLVMIVFGSKIFEFFKRKMGHTIHDVFLKFTLGLIVFCVINVILLHFQVFYGVVIYAEVVALGYLAYKNSHELQVILGSIEGFLSTLRHQFEKNKITYALYIVLLVLSIYYIYVGFNLAYIPYPTAWDANHAYIFFPRIWSIHHGLYWNNPAVLAMPNLWYGFLTFWFTFASSFPLGQGFFGISPDSLTVMMNFWSGPLVLLGTGFLLHALLIYIDSQKKHHHITEKFILPMVALGLILMILWLTSGMGAFLVFVDNKPDLAVMFFSILALYTGIKFVTRLKSTDTENQYMRHYAILSGFFFAAAILAKPTGMFDMVHFAILFLLQWNYLILAVGAYVFILGALGASKMLLVSWFLTQSQSYYLLIAGFIISVIGLIPTFKKGYYRVYVRHFFIWLCTLVATIIVYKGPFAIIQQIKGGNFSVPSLIRTIFLVKNTTNSSSTQNRVLLASTVSIETLSNTATAEIKKEQCVLPSDTKTLYTNLKDLPTEGLSEDQGRYIGFGQKIFKKTMFFSLLPEGCFSIYGDARSMCYIVDEIKGIDNKDKLIETIKKYNSSAKVNSRIETLKNNNDILEFSKIKNQIAQYVQSNTLVVTNRTVAIPYKFLIPFNVTVNWSLQNLSSYYTDIGIIWLLSLLIIIVGLIYALCNRKKHLAQIAVISIGAWVIWWVVGSAIVWYSLGIILWTILGLTVFVYELIHDKKDDKRLLLHLLLIRILILGLAVWFLTQFVLNALRIASQGVGGPFSWYKMNVGQDYVVTPQLTQESVIKFGYNADDVFKVQFPHYVGILDVLNKRKSEEGIIVAGSYMQYFIDDQSNVEADGFLTNFWRNASDNNVCNTYLRLKDKKQKYLVVDPNIASVVMGDGNNTLFDRFFAVLGSDKKTINQYGTLTMIQSLAQQGYIKLLSTNNVVSKYSYILPDQQLAPLLGVAPGEELLIERAKMSAARFFPNPEKYMNAALQVFATRVNTMEAISDIADIMGKPIRYSEVRKVAQTVMGGINKANYDQLQKDMESLSSDEKFVLQQYLGLRKLQSDNAQQFRQSVINFLQQSVGTPSQIITFSVE